MSRSRTGAGPWFGDQSLHRRSILADFRFFCIVDAIDARILRLLYWSPFNPVDVERGPYTIWDIARHLGLHGNTVKRRLAELEASGVLLGLSFFPDSQLVGLRVVYVAFGFDTEDACRAAADQVFANAPFGATFHLSNNEIRYNIGVPEEADLDAAIEEAAATFGATRHRILAKRHWDSGEITELERRVLGELHRDLFASPPDLAARVGVTPKTVRRCIQALRDKKTFCVVPLVDSQVARGLQAFHMDVDVGDNTSAGPQVLRSFPDLCPNGIQSTGVLILTGFADTPGDVADIIREIQTIPGVRSVQIYTVLRMHWVPLPMGLQSVSQMVGVVAEAPS